MRRIFDGTVDSIMADPPYLYLKNHKLDRPFDEAAFFDEVKRVLTRDGFIVLFGRGTSFYRWNTMLADRGFKFKEEIVWDKAYCTSPLMAMSRVHEMVSIHTKGKGVIKRSKIPYLEMKEHNINAICVDLKRFLAGVKNEKSLKAVLEYLENNTIAYAPVAVKNGITTVGHYECQERCTAVVKQINEGMNEKSIIRLNRDHYSAVHPTQKPVRLLERLLALTTSQEDLVLDPFSGSGSTAIACTNTARRFIGMEIDEEYFNASTARLAAHGMQADLFSTAYGPLAPSSKRGNIGV